MNSTKKSMDHPTILNTWENAFRLSSTLSKPTPAGGARTRELVPRRGQCALECCALWARARCPAVFQRSRGGGVHGLLAPAAATLISFERFGGLRAANNFFMVFGLFYGVFRMLYSYICRVFYGCFFGVICHLQTHPTCSVYPARFSSTAVRARDWAHDSTQERHLL